MRARSQAFSLVEILLVIAIIGILAGVVYVGFGGSEASTSRPDGQGRTTVGAPVARAKDEVCRQQLTQLRQIVQMQEMDLEAPPPSLDDLPGITPKMLRCPIGSEPYQYDAASGRVTCAHPGHESY
jgi:prepilin-type N-terminal cleavage/methylation domain-containing protein